MERKVIILHFGEGIKAPYFTSVINAIEWHG